MVDRAWLARLLRKVWGDSTLFRTSRELDDVAADDLTRDLVRIASRGAQPTEEMCKAQRVSALGVDRTIAQAELR